MRLVKGPQLWVAERRGRAVFTRSGKASTKPIPKHKELKTEAAAQAWLEAERAKRIADGYEVVDEDATIDGPFTATGTVPARTLSPRFASHAERVRLAVRGGFADHDAIARLIDELALEHARTVGGKRDARVRPEMTIEVRARDEQIMVRAFGATASLSEAARDHLGDVLHDVAREERVAIRAQAPPEPNINAAIDRAFAALDAVGIVARQACGFTQSDGWAEVNAVAPPTARGGCFYHEQDLARAVAGDGLLLSFGAYRGGDELAIAHDIVAALRAEQIPVTWKGSARDRIAIAPFRWYRPLIN